MAKKKNSNINPIVRNCIVVVIVVVVALAFGAIAIYGGKLVSWILRLGRPKIITTMVVSLISGILFGVVEMVLQRGGKN